MSQADFSRTVRDTSAGDIPAGDIPAGDIPAGERFRRGPSRAEAGPQGFLAELHGLALKCAVMALILVSAAGVWIVSDRYLVPPDPSPAAILQESFRLGAMIALSLVLPLIAYSYYFFRKERRRVEVERISAKLGIDDDKYVEMFKRIHSGPYFVVAVGMTWAISLGGLATLFFGDVVWSGVAAAGEGFPRQDSQLIFGMAFLGAYIWGLQYVLRRYALNDLIPAAFFRLSIRMLLASTVALILFNAYEALVDGVAAPGIWPALAFLLGAFPQRGLNWLVAKLPILSDQPDPSVRPLPLEMIEGLDAYDRFRLEEVGIDDCYDLANYDFVPLVLKTSYDARKLADWILQAKLCLRCGAAVASLRLQGIRGIHEMARLDDKELTDLAKATAATASSLRRARSDAADDPDIRCLQEVAGKLSKYTAIVPPGVGGGADGKPTVAALAGKTGRPAKPGPG